MCYRALVRLCRNDPRGLARCLRIVENEGVLPKSMFDAFAASVVFDVFGEAHKRALLHLIKCCLMLSRVGPVLQNAPPPNADGVHYILEHNSFCTRLIAKFLMMEGAAYLEAVLK